MIKGFSILVLVALVAATLPVSALCDAGGAGSPCCCGPEAPCEKDGSRLERPGCGCAVDRPGDSGPPLPPTSHERSVERSDGSPFVKTSIASLAIVPAASDLGARRTPRAPRAKRVHLLLSVVRC